MTAQLLALEPEKVGAGPLGLLFVVLMGVATVLLIRNMNTRIKRLPPEFPPSDVAGADVADAPDAPEGPDGTKKD